MLLDQIGAVVIAYLLGSFPSGYLVTRIFIKKDIRKLGSGNVGTNNVYKQVGLVAAIIVFIIDVLKGAGAVAIAAIALLNPTEWVMASGIAVIVGHIWPVFLKFKGGNGVATSLGVFTFIMTRELIIAVAVVLLIMTITRNPILSTNISLAITMPISAFIIRGDDWPTYVVFTLIITVIMVINFIPTARAAITSAGSRANLTADLLRINQKKIQPKKTR